jgi:hypothetical protein
MSYIEKWKAREPKNADNYAYERWLDERPHETPKTDYIYQMGKWLRRWIHDPAVLRKYASLGSINEQVAPFWEFAKGVKPV